jgi:hypothetical protein
MYITVIDFCRSKITINKIEKIENNADIEELILSVYPDYRESECNYMISSNLIVEQVL